MITAKKAMKQHENLPSYWSSETRLSQKILIAILDHLETAKVSKPKRKPSAWQNFFAANMKAGLTPKEIGEKWRQNKAKSASA